MLLAPEWLLKLGATIFKGRLILEELRYLKEKLGPSDPSEMGDKKIKVIDYPTYPVIRVHWMPRDR